MMHQIATDMPNAIRHACHVQLSRHIACSSELLSSCLLFECSTSWLSLSLFHPLLRKSRKLDLFILIHPGHSYSRNWKKHKGYIAVTRLHCNQLNNHIIITGDTFAHCSLCCSDFGVSHGGKHDVYVHVNGKRHKEAASAASSTCSMTSFFKPQHISRVTEAEARWALFTAKHNLSFLTSDHATKLFKTMFQDSEIAKAFACGHTKTAAII